LLTNLLIFVSLVAYSTACTRLVMALRYDLPIDPRVQFATGLVGSIAQIGLMATLMIHDGGIDFSLLKSISLVLATAVLFVTLSSQRFAIQALQLALMPIAGLFAICSVIAPSSRELLQLSAGTGLHISTSILAYGTFTVAAVMALLLGYSSLRLRHHKLTPLVKHVPPVEALESILYELLAWGTVLLGLSILTGFIFVGDFFAQHLIHKTALSILAFVIYSFICIGHWRRGWRGRRVMRWVFGAYASLTLAYVGSKLVLEWVLRS